MKISSLFPDKINCYFSEVLSFLKKKEMKTMVIKDTLFSKKLFEYTFITFFKTDKSAELKK